MMLPTDDKERKDLPIFDGVVMYFPKAMREIARVSMQGNEQHNPGEPLHWARGKSMDQRNTALRHKMDHASGNRFDGEFRGKPVWHLAKGCWRDLAELELAIEQYDAEQAAIAELGSMPPPNQNYSGLGFDLRPLRAHPVGPLSLERNSGEANSKNSERTPLIPIRGNWPELPDTGQGARSECEVSGGPTVQCGSPHGEREEQD